MLGWCMWQTMHCDDGIARVNWWLIGWPERSFGMAGSVVADRPSWPLFAYGPECFGSRSFAYGVWQAVQPDDR